MSLLDSWGLVLEPAPIQVEGRRLNGPTLKFNDRTERKNMQEADINRQSTAGHCFRPVRVQFFLKVSLLCTCTYYSDCVNNCFLIIGGIDTLVGVCAQG